MLLPWRCSLLPKVPMSTPSWQKMECMVQLPFSHLLFDNRKAKYGSKATVCWKSVKVDHCKRCWKRHCWNDMKVENFSSCKYYIMSAGLMRMSLSFISSVRACLSVLVRLGGVACGLSTSSITSVLTILQKVLIEAFSAFGSQERCVRHSSSFGKEVTQFH